MRLDREESWARLAERCTLRLRQVVDAKYSLYLLVAAWPDEVDLTILLEQEYEASCARLGRLAELAGGTVMGYSGRRVRLGKGEVRLLHQYLAAETWQALEEVGGKLKQWGGQEGAALAQLLAQR